ncbi:MAG: hypothetical protein LBL63_03555, partial [Clostridiales Family XIII bacterium]|nr:hypothetical protein [Clostridiales Family XIII bacterium]
MDVAIPIKDLLIFLLAIGGVILIIYLIAFVRNLIVALKSANAVLKDVEEITKIAAARTKDIDGVIDNVSESVSAITKNLKGEGNLLKTISAAVGFLTSLKGLFTEKKPEDGKKKN